MKVKKMMMLTFASAVLLLSGCEKENGENGNSDANIDYEEGALQVGLPTQFSNNIYFKMYVGVDKNFYAQNSSISGLGIFSCDICSVGEVNGLSSITVIPGDWFESVAIVQGYGYVGRSTREGYGEKYYSRFFVTDIVKDSNGDWLAVKIRYARLDY